MRRAAALLLILLAAGYGCSSSGPRTGCAIDQASLRRILNDAARDANVTLQHINQQTCTQDWVFVQAAFTHPGGEPIEPTGFVLHRVGQRWDVAYKGTGPLEPGNPLCGQLPAEIKQAPGFRGTCPA